MFKESSIYFIFRLVGQLSAFVAMPFIVKSLSPADYGVLGYLVLFVNIAMIVVYLGTDYAIPVFIYDKKYDPGEIKSAILKVVLLGGLFVAGLSYLGRDVIYKVLFGANRGYGEALALLIPCVFLRGSYNTVLTIYRYERKAFAYAVLQTLVAVTSLIAGIVIIYVYNGTLVHYLVAVVAIDVAAFFVTIGSCIGSLRIPVPKEVFVKILRYGLPFMPAAIVYSAMIMTDRYFITHMLPLADLGKYSVAIKLTMALTLVISAFQLAFTPYIFRYYNEHKEKALGHFENIVDLGVVLGGVGVILLTALSPLLLKLLAGPQYAGIELIVGYLAISTFALLYNNVTGYGLALKKISKYAIPLSASTFILNVILNFIFIKNMGVVGAALATAITQLTRAFAVCVISSRIEGVRFFSLRKDIILVIILFVAVTFLARSGVVSGNSWELGQSIFYGLIMSIIFYSIQYKNVNRCIRELSMMRNLTV